MARSTGTQPGVTPDGALIEDLRQRRGLSRAQLSQMTFLKPNTIQKIELYDMNVSILSASRIALALGLERYEDLLKPQPDALAGLDAIKPRARERPGQSGDYPLIVTKRQRGLPEVTPEQRTAIDQARAALVSPAPASMYELSDTAARIRELERHLDAVLRVIDQIEGEAQ